MILRMVPFFFNFATSQCDYYVQLFVTLMKVLIVEYSLVKLWVRIATADALQWPPDATEHTTFHYKNELMVWSYNVLLLLRSSKTCTELCLQVVGGLLWSAVCLLKCQAACCFQRGTKLFLVLQSEHNFWNPLPPPSCSVSACSHVRCHAKKWLHSEQNMTSNSHNGYNATNVMCLHHS